MDDRASYREPSGASVELRLAYLEHEVTKAVCAHGRPGGKLCPTCSSAGAVR